MIMRKKVNFTDPISRQQFECRNLIIKNGFVEKGSLFWTFTINIPVVITINICQDFRIIRFYRVESSNNILVNVVTE